MKRTLPMNLLYERFREVTPKIGGPGPSHERKTQTPKLVVQLGPEEILLGGSLGRECSEKIQRNA